MTYYTYVHLNCVFSIYSDEEIGYKYCWCFDLIFLLHFRLSDLRKKYQSTSFVSIISPTNEPLKYRIVPSERDTCGLSLPWTMYIKRKLCYSSLALYVCFVDRCLSFFFWSLCCLFFNLRILITPLSSTNYS